MSLLCLRLGEKALNSWLCLLAVAMNIFVIKQITILGMEVTATDALAVGYLLGLALIQEYFGTKAAQYHIFLSFICSLGFVCLSMVELLYQPNHLDHAHSYLTFIFLPMPRIFMASLTSFLVIQFIDIFVFRKLSQKLKGKFFTQRTAICLLISQVLDTFIFTYLALSGMEINFANIILFSIAIKILIICISLPFAKFSKRIDITFVERRSI